jgi:hypothetical protein
LKSEIGKIQLSSREKTVSENKIGPRTELNRRRTRRLRTKKNSEAENKEAENKEELGG